VAGALTQGGLASDDDAASARERPPSASDGDAAPKAESPTTSSGRDERPRGLRRRELVPVVAAAIAFIVIWQAVVVIGDYPRFILPGPFVVGERFVAAWLQGLIAPHFLTTLTEVILGLVVGGFAGVSTGILLARSMLASRLLSPYIVAAQATPILALAPLIALWFGTGLTSRLLICALICYFPIAVGTMVGIRSVDPRLIELGRSLRATRWQIVAQIEMPSALPQILGGLRIGVTLAVVGAIVAEWAGGDRGLGVLINLARGSMFDIPLMFATLLTIALLGVTLYLAVVAVERRLTGRRG
jgi:NitT/TauT family transport system permease protein